MASGTTKHRWLPVAAHSAPRAAAASAETKAEWGKRLVLDKSTWQFKVSMCGFGITDEDMPKWCAWFSKHLVTMTRGQYDGLVASEVDFADNNLTAEGTKVLIETLLYSEVPVMVLKLYKNSIEDATAIVQYIIGSRGTLHELHLSHNLLGTEEVAKVVVAACASTRGNWRAFCYPYKSTGGDGRQRSGGHEAIPLWLRIERNSADPAAVQEAINTGLAKIPRSSTTICSAKEYRCTPRCCMSACNECPAVHIKHLSTQRPKGRGQALDGREAAQDWQADSWQEGAWKEDDWWQDSGWKQEDKRETWATKWEKSGEHDQEDKRETWATRWEKLGEHDQDDTREEDTWAMKSEKLGEHNQAPASASHDTQPSQAAAGGPKWIMKAEPQTWAPAKDPSAPSKAAEPQTRAPARDASAPSKAVWRVKAQPSDSSKDVAPKTSDRAVPPSRTGVEGEGVEAAAGSSEDRDAQQSELLRRKSPPPPPPPQPSAPLADSAPMPAAPVQVITSGIEVSSPKLGPESTANAVGSGRRAGERNKAPPAKAKTLSQRPAPEETASRSAPQGNKRAAQGRSSRGSQPAIREVRQTGATAPSPMAAEQLPTGGSSSSGTASAPARADNEAASALEVAAPVAATVPVDSDDEDDEAFFKNVDSFVELRRLLQAEVHAHSREAEAE
mmetsp:Transcript_109858/g.309831  ORF Transcript_109858/g.309831 Transcript_109858/m.309831 type:complete len:672 (+) Transcript_109858:169-2184(+)